MTFPSASALDMVDDNASSSTKASKPIVKDPTTEYLKHLSRQAEANASQVSNAKQTLDTNGAVPYQAESDTSQSSEPNRPIVKDPTAEFLKSLSRQAESSDESVECDYCGVHGSAPPAEYYEGLSTNADLEASSSSDTSRRPKKGSSGEYLESLSRQILNVCLNLKDPYHPMIYKHQSVDFRNKHDALPRASNRADHHENLAKHLQEQKNFHVEIFNTSSEVDESRGRATIYLWYEITGLANGIEREAVAVLSWERKQGTWLLMKHIGMRGPAGFC